MHSPSVELFALSLQARFNPVTIYLSWTLMIHIVLIVQAHRKSECFNEYGYARPGYEAVLTLLIPFEDVVQVVLFLESAEGERYNKAMHLWSRAAREGYMLIPYHTISSRVLHTSDLPL